MWILLSLFLSTIALAEAPTAPAFGHGAAPSGQQLKWMRDSIEYQKLTQQTYRQAAQAMLAEAKKAKKKGWAVILDVDETALDNSTYQLERLAYGVGFELGSWGAWCERRQAAAIPGAREFVTAAREAGGTVVFISNRDDSTTTATRENLAAEGLWADGDVLCLSKADDKAYNKVARRGEVRAGSGACSTGKALTPLVYLGDNIGDFPEVGEEAVDWDAQFGVRYFVLPNPLYGGWERGVTRTLP